MLTFVTASQNKHCGCHRRMHAMMDTVLMLVLSYLVEDAHTAHNLVSCLFPCLLKSVACLMDLNVIQGPERVMSRQYGYVPMAATVN